jgi:hypothetical protein
METQGDDVNMVLRQGIGSNSSLRKDIKSTIETNMTHFIFLLQSKEKYRKRMITTLEKDVKYAFTTKS